MFKQITFKIQDFKKNLQEKINLLTSILKIHLNTWLLYFKVLNPSTQ